MKSELLEEWRTMDMPQIKKNRSQDQQVIWRSSSMFRYYFQNFCDAPSYLQIGSTAISWNAVIILRITNRTLFAKTGNDSHSQKCKVYRTMCLATRVIERHRFDRQ